jgi:hypothetical protein
MSSSAAACRPRVWLCPTVIGHTRSHASEVGSFPARRAHISVNEPSRLAVHRSSFTCFVNRHFPSRHFLNRHFLNRHCAFGVDGHANASIAQCLCGGNGGFYSPYPHARNKALCPSRGAEEQGGANLILDPDSARHQLSARCPRYGSALAGSDRPQRAFELKSHKERRLPPAPPRRPNTSPSIRSLLAIVSGVEAASRQCSAQASPSSSLQANSGPQRGMNRSVVLPMRMRSLG